MALNVFAAPARAESTFPVFTENFAGTWPALSKSRMPFQRFPLPLIVGNVCQLTFSWAAAWIASNSSGATTPRKFFTCTIWTFGMWLIELASTVTGTGVEPAP